MFFLAFLLIFAHYFEKVSYVGKFGNDLKRDMRWN